MCVSCCHTAIRYFSAKVFGDGGRLVWNCKHICIMPTVIKNARLDRSVWIKFFSYNYFRTNCMLSVFWIWSCLTLFKDGSTPIAKICGVDILPLQCLSILFSMSWVWSCLALCEEGPTPVAEIWVDSFFETVWLRSSKLRYTFHRVWFPNLLILQTWIQFCIKEVLAKAHFHCVIQNNHSA